MPPGCQGGTVVDHGAVAHVVAVTPRNRRRQASSGARVGIADVPGGEELLQRALAASIGTAKPTPSSPTRGSQRICALIPIARPRASRSGPPELPRLIGASVWIASKRLYGPSSATGSSGRAPRRRRPRARSRPERDPIAATGSPTATESELPSGTGTSGAQRGRPAGRRRRHRDPSRRPARHLVAVGNRTETARAGGCLGRAASDHVRGGEDEAGARDDEAGSLRDGEPGVGRRWRRSSRPPDFSARRSAAA